MLARASQVSCRVASMAARRPGTGVRVLSTSPGVNVDTTKMPYLHHGDRPRFPSKKKFKSPRKRASKLFHELNEEAVATSKEANPVVWKEDIRVGDAVELKMVVQGGVNAKDGEAQEFEKVRGVILGIVNRGLGSSIVIRDVVFNEPIERRIPLHSPMIKDFKVLERNFIFKGEKKVKRAKLYYFRDRNPLREYKNLFAVKSTMGSVANLNSSNC